jgi:hypothetical protein
LASLLRYISADMEDVARTGPPTNTLREITMKLHQDPKITRLLPGAALLLTAVLALPSAAAAQRNTNVFAVDGYLQADGGQCLPLRDHDGRLYVLEGRTEGLRRGDHVRLVARSAYDSRCEGGARATRVEVTEVVRVWSDEHHRTTYFHKGQNGSFESFTQSRFAYRDRYGKDRYGKDRDGWYDNNGRYHRGEDGDWNDRYGRGRDGRYDRDGRDGRYDRDRDDRYDRDGRDGDSRYDRDRDDRNDRGDYGRRVDITGRIEQAANGCLVLLDRDADIFALTGEVGRIRDGERVRVVGELGGPSRCGNRTINVRDLDRLN